MKLFTATAPSKPAFWANSKNLYINVLPNKKMILYYYIFKSQNSRLNIISRTHAHTLTNFCSCLPYSVSKFGQVTPQGIFQFNPIHQLGINRNTKVFWFYPQSQSATTDRIFAGDDFCWVRTRIRMLHVQFWVWLKSEFVCLLTCGLCPLSLPLFGFVSFYKGLPYMLQ